jgi:hypothetical protein
LAFKKYVSTKDACKQCNFQKSKESMMILYGTDDLGSLDFVKEKRKVTNMEKYGCEHPMQNQDVKSKAAKTLYENNSCKTSKQQDKIYELLKARFSNSYLNYPVDRLNLDVAIIDDKYKIDIEYDGYFWHH